MIIGIYIEFVCTCVQVVLYAHVSKHNHATMCWKRVVSFFLSTKTKVA